MLSAAEPTCTATIRTTPILYPTEITDTLSRDTLSRGRDMYRYQTKRVNKSQSRDFRLYGVIKMHVTYLLTYLLTYLTEE